MQSKCTCKSDEHEAQQQEQAQQQSTKSQEKSDTELDSEPIELCDICRYHRFLPQLNSMPDMLFNNNLLRLEHSSGVGIEFNPLDALRLVEETKDPLRVAVADGWQSARADCPFAKNISRPFDWTFTTSYRGTILSAIKKFNRISNNSPAVISTEQNEDSNRSQENSGPGPGSHQKQVNSEPFQSGAAETSNQPIRAAIQANQDDRLCLKVEETSERIDVNKLKVKEEILFYDDVTLYEDELADHGTAQYSVKVRVMPSSLFILARYYLRIDGVLARINDTRLYHELSERYILREYTNREAKLGNLELPISTVVNPSELMNHLPLIESRYEKLILPELR